MLKKRILFTIFASFPPLFPCLSLILLFLNIHNSIGGGGGGNQMNAEYGGRGYNRNAQYIPLNNMIQTAVEADSGRVHQVPARREHAQEKLVSSIANRKQGQIDREAAK